MRSKEPIKMQDEVYVIGYIGNTPIIYHGVVIETSHRDCRLVSCVVNCGWKDVKAEGRDVAVSYADLKYRYKEKLLSAKGVVQTQLTEMEELLKELE